MSEYQVTINGHTVTMQLSDEDAKELGDAATLVKGGASRTKRASEPKNKSA